MIRTLLVAALALACAFTSAEARPKHRHHHHVSHNAKPHAWCGWQMRQWFGVHNPAGNLARWWAGFGSRAHGPAIGTIVVWRHHVGQIVGRASTGQWIVRSGNDGNRIRTRPRSVSNAIAFRWPS
jgi:hypothetical protein